MFKVGDWVMVEYESGIQNVGRVLSFDDDGWTMMSIEYYIEPGGELQDYWDKDAMCPQPPMSLRPFQWPTTCP